MANQLEALIAEMKAAADQQNKCLRDGAFSPDWDDCITPENVKALIAALEQSEKQRESWKKIAQTNISEREKDIAELDTARKRIAKLEASHSQVIQARDHYKSLVSANQLAVKLPEPDVYEVNGTLFYDRLKESEVIEALRAAGITVQGDE